MPACKERAEMPEERVKSEDGLGVDDAGYFRVNIALPEPVFNKTWLYK